MMLTWQSIGLLFVSMVNMRDHGDDEFRRELATDLMRLRRIAGLNIQRASRIAYDGDEEVAELLLAEAGVMLSVVVNVERMIGVE